MSGTTIEKSTYELVLSHRRRRLLRHYALEAWSVVGAHQRSGGSRPSRCMLDEEAAV
jgi:hypothetical protein